MLFKPDVTRNTKQWPHKKDKEFKGSQEQNVHVVPFLVISQLFDQFGEYNYVQMSCSIICLSIKVQFVQIKIISNVGQL